MAVSRITGMNSGLDVDALVKGSMKPYQIKVDKEFQNQKVLEYQQEQYRKIMSDSTEFYDKYFDILKTGSLVRTDTYNTVSFESDDKSKVTAKGFAGASVDNYSVNIKQLATKATITLPDGNVGGNQSMKFASIPNPIGIVEFVVTNDSTKTAKENADMTIANFNAKIANKKTDITATLKSTTDDVQKQKLQEQLKSLNVTATYSEFSKGIVFTADQMGQGGFSLDGVGDATDKKLEGTITKHGVTQSYELKGISNTITVDNVEFNFKGTTEIKDKDGKFISGTPVQLSGTTDVKDIKDKIVNFVNDYNKLLESINTKIYETRDKDYMPLTDEQKKEMSEDQVKAWEKKAQAGLLRKDNDLERITSEMKRVMSSVMSGSGLCLEKIGIKPVKNYAEKNGMFTIDESKLTQALEENAENVKDLFTRAASEESNSTEKGGVLTQLSSILKSEFKTSTSILSKKAGLSGLSTEFNNTLSKNIDKKKQLISQLMKSLADKENALYKKYSNLETLMQNLNAQQSSLSQMLGQA